MFLSKIMKVDFAMTVTLEVYKRNIMRDDAIEPQERHNHMSFFIKWKHDEVVNDFYKTKYFKFRTIIPFFTLLLNY